MEWSAISLCPNLTCFTIQPVARNSWDTVPYFNGLKWPVHDLELVISPPLAKVASNTRPRRNNFQWRGGRWWVLYFTDVWLASHLKQERPVFCQSVSTFLQLVVACWNFPSLININRYSMISTNINKWLTNLSLTSFKFLFFFFLPLKWSKSLFCSCITMQEY